jgi:tRNA(Ile)-lysidine synthase TilS/MesJ
MALATLCSKLRQSPEGRGLSFTAFIIDHGLRPGSDDEALKVAQLLKKIGAFFKLSAGI